MSINYAILGILSYKPQTGYDIKKTIQDSPFMPWSGNNNQVYKALLELLKAGYVTNELIHQSDAPSKKIYTITNEGMAELKNWITTKNELPEFKKMFLIQLAWCEQLTDEEVDLIFSNYESELKIQLSMLYESKQRGITAPKRSPREKIIWESIYENIVSSYENEINWVQKTRTDISALNKPDSASADSFASSTNKSESNGIEKKIINVNNHNIAVIYSSSPIITDSQTAIDFCADLYYYDDCDRILLNKQSLAEEFFDLRTGVAGEILQKFVNYSKKLGIVGDFSMYSSNALKDFIYECNKGNNVFFVEDEKTAIKMLSK